MSRVNSEHLTQMALNFLSPLYEKSQFWPLIHWEFLHSIFFFFFLWGNSYLKFSESIIVKCDIYSIGIVTHFKEQSFQCYSCLWIMLCMVWVNLKLGSVCTDIKVSVVLESLSFSYWSATQCLLAFNTWIHKSHLSLVKVMVPFQANNCSIFIFAFRLSRDQHLKKRTCVQRRRTL